MTKLFTINKRGDLLLSSDLKLLDKSKQRIRELQKMKSMTEDWKLDIFIDNSCFALTVGKISYSAAFKKDVYEWGIFVLKIRFKGYPFQTEDSTLIASFPTKESSENYLKDTADYIKYRYGLLLELKKD